MCYNLRKFIYLPLNEYIILIYYTIIILCIYFTSFSVYKNILDIKIMVFITDTDTAYGYFLDLLSKALSRSAYSNLLIYVFTHLKNE